MKNCSFIYNRKLRATVCEPGYSYAHRLTQARPREMCIYLS